MLDAIAGGTPEASYPLDRCPQVAASPTCAPRRPGRWASGACRSRRAAGQALLQGPRAVGPAPGDDRAGADRHDEAIPALLPVLAETDAYLAFSARQALRRIGDWPAAAKGLDSPDPKVRAGMLLAMEQVYDGAPSSGLAEFAASTKRPVEERTEGPRVSGRGPSQGAAVGRQVVGHAAGQAEAASQDDRLGGHAARDGDGARAGLSDPIAVRSAPRLSRRSCDGRPRLAGVLAVGSRREGRGRQARDRAGTRQAGRYRGARPPDRGLARPASARAGPRRGARGGREDRLEEGAVALVELLGQKTLSAERQTQCDRGAGTVQGAAAIKPLLGSLKTPGARGAGRRRSTPWSRSSRTRRTAARDEVMRAVRAAAGRSGGRGPQPRDRRGGRARGSRGDSRVDRAAETPETRFEAALALAALPDIRALQVYLRGLDRQEHRPAQGIGGGDRQDPRPGGRGARPARRRNELPPAAMPELRSIFAGLVPVTDMARARPVSDRPAAGSARRKADRPEGELRTGSRADGCTWRAVKAGR